MIKLTKEGGDPLWVDPKQIAAIETATSMVDDRMLVFVRMAGVCAGYEVTETPEVILKLMRGIEPEPGSVLWSPHGEDGPSYRASGFVK